MPGDRISWSGNRELQILSIPFNFDYSWILWHQMCQAKKIIKKLYYDNPSWLQFVKSQIALAYTKNKTKALCWSQFNFISKAQSPSFVHPCPLSAAQLPLSQCHTFCGPSYLSYNSAWLNSWHKLVTEQWNNAEAHKQELAFLASLRRFAINIAELIKVD